MKDLASLLYYKFIFKKQHDPLRIARQMNISRDLIYKWCRGEARPTLDRLKDLIRVTGDDEIREFVSREYLGVSGGEEIESIEKSELRLFVLMSDLVEEVDRALEDRVITKEEKARIEPLLVRLEEGLERLREKIRLYEK
jgi:transcriptional regulator with XRE-family HTH domain